MTKPISFLKIKQTFSCVSNANLLNRKAFLGLGSWVPTREQETGPDSGRRAGHCHPVWKICGQGTGRLRGEDRRCWGRGRRCLLGRRKGEARADGRARRRTAAQLMVHRKQREGRSRGTGRLGAQGRGVPVQTLRDLSLGPALGRLVLRAGLAQGSEVTGVTPCDRRRSWALGSF